MDSFKIGDKVIYPNQGIGIIEDIQEENHYGESFKIYRVRIISNNTLVLVPSSNTEEIGIRKPITEDSIDEIFEFMRNGKVDVTKNWKGRYKEHLNLMKSGSILDMALVLKSLYYLNLIKPLSFREKKMMERAKNLIVSEISEVSSLPKSEIEMKLLRSLSLCFRDLQSQIDS
ncbi:MAG: CarD family transcriptional regulator [Candidatus Aminicenantales bacterium]